MKNQLRDTIVTLGSVVVVTALVSLPPLDRFHGLDIDVLHWLRANILPKTIDPADSPTVVVAIDEKTHGASPFKGIPKVMWTPQIAEVQAAVLRGGAKVFGWDVILPTSASTYLNNRRFDQALLKGFVGERRSGRIVLGEVQLSTQAIAPHRAFAMMVGGAVNIRNLDIDLDDDGISRSLPLFQKMKSKSGKIEEIPGMAMELAARAAGERPRLTPDGVEFLGRVVSGGKERGLVLNFDAQSGAIPTYSFADLYHCARAGNADYFQRAFAGKVVLLGLLLDIEDRKLSSNRMINRPDLEGAPPPCLKAEADPVKFASRSTVPGLYLHATAVNNLLRGEALDLPGTVARIAAPLPLATLGALLMLLLTPLRAALGLTVAAGLWTIAATWLFRDALVLPLIDPLAAISMTSVVTLSYRFIVIDKDKRYLRQAFSSYVSPNLVDIIVNNPDGSAVAARRQECTFIFTDLADFTAMVEIIDPDILPSILNDYIDGMISIAFSHNGTLDKVVGDALVIFFSAPIYQSDHAQRAVDCALELDAWARDYAARMNNNGIPMGKTRVGVNTGLVVVGNFGGSSMFDYTAHGDAVNTAARLESVNKHLGTNVCISGNTVEKCQHFVGRPAGKLVLKGKSEGTKVFEPLTEAEMESPMVQAYLTAYTLKAAGDPSAAESFASAAADFPDDSLIAFHHARLKNGETGEKGSDGGEVGPHLSDSRDHVTAST